jgi:diadenosine tetraphosphate (Ap4A) HIT family hydrolase
MDCFICRKHAGEVAPAPGGWIYEDERWRVCHAPLAMSVPGQLLVESRRHFLDFAEMTPDEAASYGLLLARLFAAVKRATGAERIYTLVTIEGAAHFHTWLVPRIPNVTSRGVAFLAEEHTCTENEALEVVATLRAALGA